MEEWKSFGKYEISNYGRVKSLSIRPGIVKLHPNQKGYLRYTFNANNPIKTITIHTLVWDLFGDKERKKGLYVDHINENKEDNCIDNLQLLTNRENCSKGRKKYNYTSQYTGVSRNKRDKCWIARIAIDGNYRHLGSFQDEYKAHLAYQNTLIAYEYTE